MAHGRQRPKRRAPVIPPVWKPYMSDCSDQYSSLRRQSIAGHMLCSAHDHARRDQHLSVSVHCYRYFMCHVSA